MHRRSVVRIALLAPLLVAERAFAQGLLDQAKGALGGLGGLGRAGGAAEACRSARSPRG